jgi:TRAP-type C4-dicarboxylate transport system permease small subunit
MPVQSESVGSLPKFRAGFQRFLEWIVLGLVAFLATIVVAGVTFRKLGMPLVWYDELASIMLAWLTYYGACLAALRKAHIGFPNIVDSAPRGARRFMIIVREIVVVGFFLLAAWAGWRVVLALDDFYMATLTWMPRQVTQSVIPISAILFIIAELLNLPDMLRGEVTSVREEDLVK